MNFSDQKRRSPLVNVTPLIDALFLLLIQVTILFRRAAQSLVELLVTKVICKTPVYDDTHLDASISRNDAPVSYTQIEVMRQKLFRMFVASQFNGYYL